MKLVIVLLLRLESLLVLDLEKVDVDASFVGDAHGTSRK